MDDKLTEQAVKNVLATERFGAGDPKKQKNTNYLRTIVMIIQQLYLQSMKTYGKKSISKTIRKLGKHRLILLD